MFKQDLVITHRCSNFVSFSVESTVPRGSSLVTPSVPSVATRSKDASHVARVARDVCWLA